MNALFRDMSVEPLLAIAREAGDLVLRLQNDVVRSPRRHHIKQDGSLRTEADVQSHDLIAARLRALTPSIPIVAEEQPADVNQRIMESGKPFWLVDSLDNTSDYAQGGRHFSVNIALIDEEGYPRLGVLIFPGLEELYFTGDDGKAYKQSERDTPQRIRVLPFPAASEAAMKMARHPGRTPGIGAFLGRPLTFITTRGQRRACLVASGEVALCVENEGFYIWDTAPVAAILEAAGGGLYAVQDGQRLRYHQELRLPAYVAAATHDIPQRMGLFAGAQAKSVQP